MYEELINSLRYCATHSCMGEAPALTGCTAIYDDAPKDCDSCNAVLQWRAADAIEELSKKRVGTWHRVKASQRSYSFVCNSCGSMYPYLTRCCPNCGVEYIDEEPLVVD